MADGEKVVARPASAVRVTESADEVRMSFGDHLEELRRRILYAVIGLAVAVIGCFFLADTLVGVLCQPLLVALRMAGLPPQLYQEKVPQLFINYMETSLLSGVIIASPWIIYQVWLFVAVGLYSAEKRYVRRYGLMSLGLFLAGAAFVYLIVMPFALKYFIEFSQGFKPPDPRFLTPIQKALYNGQHYDLTTTRPDDADLPRVPRLAEPPAVQSPSPIWIDAQTEELQFYDAAGQIRCVPTTGNKRSIVAPWFNLADYLQFTVSMMLVFGVAFQMPLVILFLAAVGIVQSATMARQRRLVILIIVIIAAVISPTTDAISLALMALPMMALFELGLILARRSERRRAAAETGSSV